MKSPILNRLVEKYPVLSSLVYEGVGQSIDEDISNYNSEFIESCLAEHAILVIEFDVLCNQIITQKKEITDEQIQATLCIANILEINYRHLQMKTLAIVMEEYKQVLQYTIKKNNFKHQQLSFDDIEFGNWIRRKTVSSNVWRLLLIRIKRLLEALLLVISYKHYQACIHYLSKLANPFIAILGWAFFAPRLYVNIYELAAHYYAYLNANKEAKNYFYRRMLVQLNYRWFESFNDGPWHLLGLAVCCLLLAHLAPIAIYLNVILYTYDILLPSIRFYVENVRLVNLYNVYINCLVNKDGYEAQKIIAYCNFLEKKMSFEQKRLAVSVVTTTLLAVVVALLMPCFAINPAVPIVCAAMLVIITIASYLTGKKVEKMKPVCSVEALENKLSLKNNSIFKENKKKENDATKFQSGLFNLCSGTRSAS